jgi:hypothetical protein
MYLASAIRHHISFPVSKLSQFTLNPGDDHWCAFERVMHYLAGTMDYKIHYSRYPAVLGDTMMQIGYLMWTSCMPRMDMFSLLAVHQRQHGSPDAMAW